MNHNALPLFEVFIRSKRGAWWRHWRWRLLNWFLPDEDNEEKVESRPPVIGLTATPFRGRNEEETQRLASRFGRRMLPAADKQPDLYDHLRADGILSTIDAEALRHEIPFEFTKEELEHLERFNEFPESALQRLAGDQSRSFSARSR